MKKLRALRVSRGLSQQALADRAGIRQAHLSRIEAGLHDPRWSTVLRLAYSLGAEPEDLVSSPNGPKAPVGAENGANHA